MASTSSSSSFSYDVFLSFSGCFDFTRNLYNALIESGIRTSIEEEKLRRGEYTVPAILKAIDESMIAIPVLSEDYASLSFCLDELVKITECMEKKGMIVMPIFYNIDPSDVRHQRGSYGEAFAIHEEMFKDNMDMVQKWRMALSQVANLSGWVFGNRYLTDLLPAHILFL